jgi:glycosyltransferase involved in cell wall biosynthesis
LHLLESIRPLEARARRLARRRFAPLANAPTIQGRLPEFRRRLLRAAGRNDERLVDEANDWVMRTMAQHLSRATVTAVHAYEDCALDAFVAAERLGRSRIYDLPIGYHAAWARVRERLEARYGDWALPASPTSAARQAKKSAEMELADLVLVPSQFVARTVREFHPDKNVVIAPYGVDSDLWPIEPREQDGRPLTFLFAGQCSIRKGVPLLLKAWRAAGLKNARLKLVGSWQLAEAKKAELPDGASWTRPVASGELRTLYAEADVFTFPTNFEGRALVVLEALASGLPVLTTEASGAEDAVAGAGQMVPPDDLDALVEALRWFDTHRGDMPALSRAARARAEACTWGAYRKAVVDAVRPIV